MCRSGAGAIGWPLHATLAAVLGISLLAGCVRRIPDDPGQAPTMTCGGVVDDRGTPTDDRITWHAAPDRDDRERLDRSCAVVGPAVVARPPAPVAASGVGVDDVAIVTWNVHAGAGDLTALVAAVRAGFAGLPPRRHIVLILQEANRAGTLVPARIPAGVRVPRAVRTAGATRGDVVASARALSMHLVYIPSMRNGRHGPSGPEDRGNAILSTLPLSDVAAIELPVSRDRRVSVAATVSGEDAGGRWRLRLVSVHLDTVGTWRNLYVFSSHLRARQAGRLIDVVRDVDAVVIGADMNSWSEGPAEAAVALFRRAFPDTPAPRWQPTFQAMWRLDYLFFRVPKPWRVAVRRLDSPFGSDHHPVVGGMVRTGDTNPSSP